ncbi:hypothetical protein D7035_21685, partial [Aquimarina sp. AD1]
LLEFSSDNNLKLYIKSKSKRKFNDKMVVLKPYFDNYFEILEKAKYVVLDIPYKYRVSGVFYESMSLNKKIILINPQGLYGREMYRLYPNNISLGFMEEQLVRNSDNSIFLKAHNDSEIRKKITNAIQ